MNIPRPYYEIEKVLNRDMRSELFLDGIEKYELNNSTDTTSVSAISVSSPGFDQRLSLTHQDIGS